MHLFVEPKPYEGKEKTAAEVALPDDPNLWPGEVLQELYKQVPYIADFDPQPVMARVDAEKGAGFGHVEVRNQTMASTDTSPESLEAAGVQSARIPIVIRNGKLLPFDLLITGDSKMLPLTEERLRQALFRPQMFDITAKSPGDQSVIGQLYPPHRDNFGYGGAGAQVSAGMGKMGSAEKKAFNTGAAAGGASAVLVPGAQQALRGSVPPPTSVRPVAAAARKAIKPAATIGTGGARLAVGGTEGKIWNALGRAAKWMSGIKTGSVLETIVPTINEDDYIKFAEALADEELQAAYNANGACTRPALQKLAKYQAWSLIKSGSAILDGVKPSVMQIQRVNGGYKVKTASHRAWAPKEEIIDRGRLVKMAGVKIALDADVNKTVTVATDANVDRDLPEEEAPEQIKDFGVWKVMQEDGTELVGLVFPSLYDFEGQLVPTSLFTNGSQSALQPDMAGVRMGEVTSLPESPVRGQGIFYKVTNEGAVGTIPITVKSGAVVEDEPMLIAETFDGQPLRIKKTEGIEVPVMIDDTTAAVPEDWDWLSLGESEPASLVEQAEEASNKEASAREFARSVTIRAGGPDSFSLSGVMLDKLAHDQREFLNYDNAVFTLAGLGIAPAYAQEKLACAVAWNEPIQVRVGRYIETVDELKKEASAKAAAKLKGFNMRVDLIKEAAFIPDPLAVDTVLALGFINPENVTTFINSLPLLEEAQQKLCELLLGARVGLPGLDPNPVERAVKSLEEVIEGLKVLAFQKS